MKYKIVAAFLIILNLNLNAQISLPASKLDTIISMLEHRKKLERISVSLQNEILRERKINNYLHKLSQNQDKQFLKVVNLLELKHHEHTKALRRLEEMNQKIIDAEKRRRRLITAIGLGILTTLLLN